MDGRHVSAINKPVRSDTHTHTHMSKSAAIKSMQDRKRERERAIDAASIVAVVVLAVVVACLPLLFRVQLYTEMFKEFAYVAHCKLQHTHTHTQVHLSLVVPPKAANFLLSSLHYTADQLPPSA